MEITVIIEQNIVSRYSNNLTTECVYLGSVIKAPMLIGSTG